MTIQQTWQSFPPTYRAEEMQILARWILAGEGGSVVGLGAVDTGFESFGEVTERKTRAELLDEGLEIEDF